MSMQNLTATSAAANQLFSKALQENGGQHGAADGSDGQNQQQTGISAADLQQFMLSQLDQQLYLSQLTSAGFGSVSGGPETSTSSALFLPSATSTDSATTTASSQNGTTTTTTGTVEGEMIQQLKQQQNATSNPALSSNNNAGLISDAAQLAQQQQNLMEQLLEAAASQQNNSMDGTQNGGGQSAEEIGQLMAQLMAANGGGQAADQLQAQLLQQLANSRGDVQSPSQQQAQQQLSLFDQLQVFQILGGQGNVAGLADFLTGAGANSALGQFAANSMGHDFVNGGMMLKGGSPNKDADTYCDICNKNVCNRYFLKTHKEKKHGIINGVNVIGGKYNIESPTKFNNGCSEISQFGFHKLEEPPGRAQSASLQQQNQQQQQQRDSPSSYHQHQRQKQSLSSTPGLGAGTNPPATVGSSLNDTADQQQQQLMNQCIMQQLAAQLAIPTSNNQNGQERSALIEQILNSAGLPLSELLQQQQQNCRASPAHSSPDASTDQFPCAHCARQFPSQSALFQHQLSEHIGTTNEQHWPISGDGGATQQQQQQFLGQLLGSPQFPGQNNAAAAAAAASLMLPSFGQLNGGADMDGAAMLAKLSAELAAVSQQQNGQGGGHIHGQNQQQIGNGGIHHQPNGGQMKPMPQKRQYQSTSKNFCDLCNKDVCNKYFLRTHMLKMHNIVIDENKVVIANIDTAEKERRGEVKFRCEICGNSMQTRELLKLHKREVHGMQPIAIQHSMHTPPHSKTSGVGFGLVSRGSMETMEAGIGARKLSSASTFTPPTINKIEHRGSGGEHAAALMGGGQMQKMPTNDENDQPPMMERADGGGGVAGSALPISSVKQLLSQLYSSADPQLAGGQQLQQMNIKREDSQDGQQQYNQNTENNNTPETQPHSDANNNAGLKCCRFCGISFESEQELELHQLVIHLDLVHSGLNNSQPQEELVTQVALEMAKANSQKKKKKAAVASLRKSSAASSGGASSSSSQSSHSAASSAQSASSSALLLQHQQQSSPSSMKGQQIQAINHPCHQCKRTYKTMAKLEAHQRMVHQHNFVAKISPTKRTLTISPKKISKMLKCFSCVRCQRRFSTKMKCNEHVISAHIRPAELGDNGTQMKRAKMDGEEEEEEGRGYEECHQGLLREWVREVDGESREEEEEDDEDGHGNSLGRLVVDEGEMMNEGDGKKEGTERKEECHRQTKNPSLGENVAHGKEGGEKHSHTSGSTSPVSVQASHSSLVLPEGFAHPHPEHQKPFLLQSFTIRPIHSPDGASNSADNTSAVQHALPDELVAYLPVRAQLSERVRVTLELQPNPLIDSQVRHL